MIKYFLVPHPPIIIPEVGKGRESEVSKTMESYKEVSEKIADTEPKIDTIIIISPHGVVFKDAISIITEPSIEGDFSNFGADEVKLNYEIDMELTNKIIKKAQEKSILVAEIDRESSLKYDVPLELDHGAAVPLYYIGKERGYKLVHINYGMLSPIELLRFGSGVKEVIEMSNKNVAVIASGDLSHRLTEDGPYEYNPLGKKFDEELIDILLKGDMKELFKINRELIKEAGECGLRSLYILAGIINSEHVDSELFSYEGNLGVGYGVMEFKAKDSRLIDSMHLEKEKLHRERVENGSMYTALARRNLEKYFDTGKLIDIEDVKEEELLGERRGVFVSLKINGDLRGCIGTIEPTTESVAEEIIRNSLSAALNDPRFEPLKKEELFDISISVDLLHSPEKANFADLDPEMYGVIVTSAHKSGLLLPNLEGVTSKGEQVRIAMSKGGILPHEDYELERFKVERFSEGEENE